MIELNQISTYMNIKRTLARLGKGHIGKVTFRPKKGDCSLLGTIDILPAKKNIQKRKKGADKKKSINYE